MLQSYLAKFVYRPPRDNYQTNTLPESLYTRLNEEVPRFPLEFNNSRGEKIVGSFYKAPKTIEGHPCVIYLHGNASSQKEGQFLVYNLSHLGISVCCIDFTGCGHSDGNRIGLGLLEREDVKATINELRTRHGIDKIILWGRSMGAGTAAWYAGENDDISAIICDSPYISIMNIADDFVERLPCAFILKGLVRILYPWLNWSVKKEGKYSMTDINYFDELKNAHVPALFLHAYGDTFIGIRESREIFAEYGCDEKYLLTFKGGHNSSRPKHVIAKGVNFIRHILRIDEEDKTTDYAEDEDDDKEPGDMSQQHFENIIDMMGH